MISYYATGAPFPFKSDESTLRKNHVARLASPGAAGRMDQRNFKTQEEHEFKATTRHTFSTETYSQNKRQVCRDFKSSLFFDYSAQTLDGTNHKQPHLHNFRVDKSRAYASQSSRFGGQEGELQSMSPSQVISKEAFSKTRGQRMDQSADKVILRKRNFYMTRPYHKINHFDRQEPITNVNIVSKDNLNWIADSNRAYENLGNTKQEIKKQQVLLSNKDIIGNEKQKHPKEDKKFVLSHPGVSHRAEAKRMHPIDNTLRNTSRHFSEQELRKGKVHMTWEEKPQNQGYDLKKVTGKVGAGSRPYIKQLEVKRSAKDTVTKKISRNEVIEQPLKQDKYATLKIGHGQPEILTYKA